MMVTWSSSELLASLQLHHDLEAETLADLLVEPEGCVRAGDLVVQLQEKDDKLPQVPSPSPAVQGGDQWV